MNILDKRIPVPVGWIISLFAGSVLVGSFDHWDMDLVRWFPASILLGLLFFILTAKLVNGVEGTKWEPLAYPVLIVFVIADFILNWTTATWLCLEPPQTLRELVTQRINRYKDDYEHTTGLNLIERWRFYFSETLGKQLNRHDEGHYE